MFDLPTMKNVTEVVCNGEVIAGNAKPLFIYGEAPAEAEAVEAS